MAEVRKTALTKRERELGRRARDRAMARAGGGRIPESAWLPEIEHLQELGLTIAQIARAVQLSERRVREIRQYATETGMLREVPEAKDVDALAPDLQACLEFSGAGFKRFYERFSGMTLPRHCEAWVDQFTQNRNLMLNVPPRHMKSSIFSLWVPVWLLCRDRNERILLVSLTKESAKKWVAGIAEQLSVNDAIVEAFGRFRPVRTGDQAWRPLSGTLMVSGRTGVQRAGVQYSVESRGSGQQILGMEATVVIIDDVTDKKTSDNELARGKELDWLRGDVLSRVETQTTESSGRAVIVGQRVGINDVYGTLSSQVFERGPRAGEPLWNTIKTPAILRWPDEDPENPEPQVLWPEKWSFDELMLTYERVGGHAMFSTMYQQEPIADGETIFKPEWWVNCRDYDRAGGEGVDRGLLPISRVFSIDPSVKQFHGLVVADVLYDRNRFVTAVIEAKRWKGPQRSIIKEIIRVLETYGPDYFVFEDVSFIQWLKEDPFYIELQEHVRVIPHQTYKNKGDIEMGVESLAREVEFGEIRIPWGDDWGREMSKLLIDEATGWPHNPISDILMALWFIKWNYKRFVPADLVYQQMNWVKGYGGWAGFERTG